MQSTSVRTEMQGRVPAEHCVARGCAGLFLASGPVDCGQQRLVPVWNSMERDLSVLTGSSGSAAAVACFVQLRQHRVQV
jgi:hypothetical protein